MTEPARRALACLDLTSLTGDEDEAAIVDLCARARTPVGPVAAVCVDGAWAARAKAELAGSGVKVAAVANFPDGHANPRATGREVAGLRAAGADEVDVVLPWRAWLEGDRDGALAVLQSARAQAGRLTLKVILETGRLGDGAQIRAAAEAALGAGADFLKTSTGKLEPAATPAAALVMLEAIRDLASPAGFKAAGGIRTTAQAAEYLALADSVMGPRWAGPATFRLGASGLLSDLLATLGAGDGGPPAPPAPPTPPPAPGSY